MKCEAETITIRAAPEQIFTYLADPENLASTLSSNIIAEIYDINPLEAGGYSYRWKLKLLGFGIDAASHTTIYEPYTRFGVRSEGLVNTLSLWQFDPLPGGETRTTFSISYEPNMMLISRLTEPFMAGQVRYSVQVAVMTVKHLVEAKARQQKKDQAKSKGQLLDCATPE